ncbi:hypothetical protein PALA111701_05900 [Paenibacillus lactis]
MPQWLEIILRTLCAVIVLFLLTKALGKRQVTQLSFFEYLTGITIGSLAAYISLDLEANWYLGLIALGVWVLCSLLIEYSQMKSKKVRDFIDFKATVLIKDGKVLEDNMKKERLTSDDLMQQLRKKDIFQIADVEFAIMESSGDITVLQKRDTLPVTPKDLGLRLPLKKCRRRSLWTVKFWMSRCASWGSAKAGLRMNWTSRASSSKMCTLHKWIPLAD